MPTDLNVHCGLLAQQLRVNGLKEPKVREVVAQVADHAVATGEDPVVAFGQPIDYAAQWRYGRLVHHRLVPSLVARGDRSGGCGRLPQVAVAT